MVKYYNSGWYLDGDTVYRTEETCEDGKRVRAIQPQERTKQAGMTMCETCRRIGQDRQSKNRYYGQ
jgi:hypothetical protein